MSKSVEIQQFLNDFHAKMGIWGVVFRDDRGKNTEALLLLEISQADRIKVLAALKVADYSEGPLDDILHKGAGMWVFGKMVKQEEIYIKITMGICGAQVICISFHLAEHQMKYPFRKE